ncbi:hypothetical protein [Streptomyces sp. A012304]|nr:hypothetical protein [Streptomyces sp. A012304]GKQ38588.1 hypothetical protein ALMP_51190 [Streptomyces sp. A012304]
MTQQNAFGSGAANQSNTAQLNGAESGAVNQGNNGAAVAFAPLWW